LDDPMPETLREAAPASRPFLNLPNALTLSRIFLVPFLVGVLLVDKQALLGNPELVARLTPREILGVSLFLVASLTDWLDGWFARRRGQVTTLGVLLDPIADKLLVCSAFIALAYNRNAPAWIVILIVGRELAVSGLRSVAASLGTIIPASRWGKYKTASQVVAVTLLILTPPLQKWGRYEILALWSLYLATLLSISSAADYFYAFLRRIPWVEPPGPGE
jgi:CDP-diacylglycerol--glycerol-3-phosphate 3-phosphatidyltransferase